MSMMNVRKLMIKISLTSEMVVPSRGFGVTEMFFKISVTVMVMVVVLMTPEIVAPSRGFY